MSLLSAMTRTRRGNDAERQQLERLQRQRLEKLVRFAAENSPYYARRFAEAGVDVAGTFALTDLPRSTKPQVMAAFDDVLTDRTITMERINRFTQDLDNVGRLLDGKCLVFKTSGSTGNPAVVLYDRRCIDVQSAIAAFRTFARREDYRAFMSHGKRTAGVFANYGFYLACGMSRHLQLRMPRKQTKITVDVNAPEEQIVRELNAFQPAMLSGYPSNLALLADCPGLDIHPDVVITGGELLTDAVRAKLTDRFGCYVQTHYSCTEAGEVACECSAGHLHVNEDWIIVEPVDRDGRPVPCGELSDAVLITNLANYIQPFIRYELTDRVIMHDEPCSCGRHTRWLEIEGRTDDTLEFPGGVRVAPMSLYKVLEEVPELRRFQLVQTAPDAVTLRMVAEDPDAAFAKASAALQEFFAGKGLSVAISRSSEAPQAHPVSGKFKHVYREFL